MKKVLLFIISIVLFGCITSIYATTPTVNKKMVGSSKQKITTVSGEASFGNLPKKETSVIPKDPNINSGMMMSGKTTTLKERLEVLKAKKIKKDAYLKVTAEKMKILQEQVRKKDADLKAKQDKMVVKTLSDAIMPKGSSLTTEQEKELGGILRLIKKNLTEEEKTLVKNSVDNWWKSLDFFLNPSDWQVLGQREQIVQLTPSEYKKYLIDSKDERMKMIAKVKESMKEDLLQRNLIPGKEEMAVQRQTQEQKIKDDETKKEDAEIFDTSKGSTYSFTRQNLTEEEKVQFRKLLLKGLDIPSRFVYTDEAYDKKQLIIFAKQFRKEMISGLIDGGFIQKGREAEFEKVADKKTEKIVNGIINRE